MRKQKQYTYVILHHVKPFSRDKVHKTKRGWLIRYKDKRGRFSKFTKRKLLKPYFFLKKRSYLSPLERREQKIIAKAQKAEITKEIEREVKKMGQGTSKKVVKNWKWTPTRRHILIEARKMAKAHMVDLQKDIPWQVKEASPISFKQILPKYRYMNDYKVLQKGNGITFYILIGIYVSISQPYGRPTEEHVDFLIIRRTILMEKIRDPKEWLAFKPTFDDLGQDYVRRKGMEWGSTDTSPQIANITYIGTLAFALYPYKF